MKKIIFLRALCLLVFTANFVFTQTADSMPSFKPEIKRVAVFKNGYVFTYREGITPTKNGWAYTNEVPIGVMGTIWGYSSLANVKIKQLLASESEKAESARVAGINEILLLNEGGRIRFTDGYDSNKIYQGTYEIISPNRGLKSAFEDGGRVLPAENVIIALKTETGTIFFPVGSVRNVEIVGQPKYVKTVTTKENRLAIKTEGAADGQAVNLGVAALERGIRWIPSYRIEARGEPIKEARLELEAVLINELADLNDSEVYFVVGVPSFAFQDTLSPLSLNQTFAGVSSYFQTGGRNAGANFASNAIMTQQVQTNYSADGADVSAFQSSPEEERAASLSAEQLYLYKTDQMNLKKGERTSLRLFSMTVPASEVFEWTVADAPQTDAEYSSRPNPGQDLSKGIWYALRLKNQTGMPLTTAPAITFREWKPLGQDLIRFTPNGGENILRVSPATEVIGTHALEEKGRETVNLRINNTTQSFDLITVEGKLKIRNVKKQPVEMIVTRNVVGEIVSTTDNGKISREGFNLQSLNPNSRVKWNVVVPSGEKEITYTYKIYVRK